MSQLRRIEAMQESSCRASNTFVVDVSMYAHACTLLYIYIYASTIPCVSFYVFDFLDIL